MLIIEESTPTTTTGHTAPARSVGVVQRQYAPFDEPLFTRSGVILRPFTVAYETYGTLNSARSNAILICHALSGDAHVAGYHTTNPDEKPGWWDEAVGPGKIFDTDHFFVICSNVIGGCQGSTGPSSLAPDGKPYALRFPNITVPDMVQAQRHLLDHLGIDKLFAVAGGSMGGMQALQWGVETPERVGAVIFLASTSRSSTQQIAFNETGRQAIYADPNWNNGEYYDGPAPNAGLAVARMMAHITYMSDYSLDHKFGRQLQSRDRIPYTFFEPEFAVESYLAYQGRQFIRRFDANSYLYITKAIDYFDIGADYGSLHRALERTECDFLVASFSSDWLYPAYQSEELANGLEYLGRSVEYYHVDAPFGHDSFLVEVDRMKEIVGGYLDRRRRRLKI
ncbi:MAG TPA: homoserine O-acetyltransferase [Aggregatilineaceae bacterium]|nr:homoserine O-acetyltransferase [Aggregatilineaceae bacterium]